MGHGFVRIQREAHASGCGPLLRARARVMDCGLNFASTGLTHMLMSGRIIPAIGEPPTPPSVDSALRAVLPPLGVSFGLQIGD